MCVCVCVCVSDGRSPEAVRPRLKTFFFFAKLQLDATSETPPTLTAKALAPGLKDALLQSVVQKLDREVGLRVTAKRLSKSSR